MNAFDSEQRETVRQSLLGYMRRHGIGVPRLAGRISEANPREPKIPIKTLQRFLAGKMRTTDIYVGFFSAFAESQAEPLTDPMQTLGKAMAAFYGSEKPERFAGAYGTTVSYDNVPGRGDIPFGMILTADQGFCRVNERARAGRNLIFDGVLVFGPTILIVNLQDRLTKCSKHYLLEARARAISGRGTEAVLLGTTTGRALLPVLIKVDQIFALSSLSDEMERLVEPYQGTVISRSTQRRSVPPLGFPGSPPDVSHDPPKGVPSMASNPTLNDLLAAADRAEEDGLSQLAEAGIDINGADPATGLTALHLAVGRGAFGAVRFLVERGASFGPDKFGRTPSSIAAECEVSEELCDYIAEEEEHAEEQNPL